MGELRITFKTDDGKEVSLSLEQMNVINRLLAENPGAHWHMNNCDCCVTVHAGDEAYVVDSDGEYDHFNKDRQIIAKQLPKDG